jgi:hypothetical protein
MSTENTELAIADDVNLDDFAADFFGQKEAAPVEANPEVTEDADPVDDAPLEDTQSTEVDTLADENETEDEVEDEAPEPAPKKNRFQERIDELNGKFREEERQRQALEAQLTELKAKLEGPKPEPTTPKEVDDGSPNPYDTNEDGTEKYPLGELDPQFIADLTRHAIRQEREAWDQAQKDEADRREAAAAQANLQVEWNGKVEAAQERYPDFAEAGQSLIESLGDLEPAYGDYLASTIMGMDYGTEVLYYLAKNPNEARQIADSGARAATVALGRIEAKFALAGDDKPTPRQKVSRAPAPPPANKGSAVNKPKIKGDEDDLSAFEREFFTKKRR